MYSLSDLLNEMREGLRAGDFGTVQEAVRHAVSEQPLVSQIDASRMLHSEAGLTVFHTVVAPGFVSPPHDHRTWAVIGVYSGQEDNAFYRLTGASRSIEPAGGVNLREKEVMLLGEDAIHHIANRGGQRLIALHVYGKNIFEIERSAWDVNGVERPFSLKLDRGGVLRSPGREVTK